MPANWQVSRTSDKQGLDFSACLSSNTEKSKKLLCLTGSIQGQRGAKSLKGQESALLSLSFPLYSVLDRTQKVIRRQ